MEILSNSMTTPTTHQAAAIEPILSILERDYISVKESNVVLGGYGGTGKSYCTGYICDHLLKQGLRVTAITHAHKALAVLSAFVPDDVECMTVFRALGWRINKRTGLPLQTGRSSLYATDVLIVDEASMIDTAMYEALIREQGKYGFRILWVGDPGQLPPVGQDEGVPPVFGLVEQQYRLTEIVRQAADSPIIAASMYVRECLQKGARPDVNELLNYSGNGDVIQVTHGGLMAVVGNVVSALDHGLNAVAVGWTNRSIERVNSLVSKQRHPCGTTRIAPGDSVTFGTSLMYGEKPVVATDSIGRVLDVTLAPKHGCISIDCLELSISIAGQEPIWCHTPIDIEGYNKNMRSMKRALKRMNEYVKQVDAKDAQEAYNRRDELGVAIHECAQDYADVRHMYGITAHKSQGSTFDAVVIDWEDMSKNRNNYMLCRLLYVAMTRPSKYLVIVQ